MSGCACGETYNEWVDGQFTAAQAVAGDAAPHADPDRDGLPNVAEYALGSRPLDATSVPRWQIDAASRGVVFPQPSARGDAVTRVEASADLRSWQASEAAVASAGQGRCPLPGGTRFARLVTTVADGARIDSDGDGLHDLFEETLIAGNPGDAHSRLADVRPGDDFDGDGLANVLDPANRAPGQRSNPGPVLMDPQRVAAAADARPSRNPPVLEVHTPLEP